MRWHCRKWMLLGVLTYMAIIAVAVWLKISFSRVWFNALVLFVGYCALGGLFDVFLRAVRLRRLRWPAIGVMWSLWLAGLLLSSPALVSYPEKSDAVTASPGLVCRALYQGADSGGIDIEIDVYHPLFLGLEKKVSTLVLHDGADVAGPHSLKGCPPIVLPGRI